MKVSFKHFKKSFFIFFFSFMHLFAQEKKGNNEFKINIGSLLFKFPELSYEYIINDESSVGVSLAFPLDKEISYRFIAYPNYRVFFGNKRAKGFFIEVNSAIFSQQNKSFIFGGSLDSNNSETKMGFGLGIAIGGKFLTKNGFIGEIYVGMGRNFINTDAIDRSYPRAGISFGRRF